MAKLVSLLISARQQRLIGIAMGLAIFAMLLLAAGILARLEIQRAMAAESRALLVQVEAIHDQLDTTFAAIENTVVSEPCSPAFQAELRRVGFLPDGFSEFLYAPGSDALCSNTGNYRKPVRLGSADILPSPKMKDTIWMDRGLGFAGLGGLVGTIVRRQSMAIVVPPQKISITAPAWLDLEIVFLGYKGRYWHRGGEVEVYDRYTVAQGPRASFFEPLIHQLSCDEQGFHCIAGEADPLEAVEARFGFVLAVIVALALLSAWLAGRVRTLIMRHWSFEARFRRHLDAKSVICAYQPIMAVGTGEIVGCEVLARWRDVDDGIVYPDRFIPLVERYGLTEAFTRLVVERAHRELSAALPRDRRLTLTFNIFPRDLDCDRLMSVFSLFQASRDRFDIVVELVESDAVDMNVAQHEIESLRGFGIRTYIDDFGTGYSNIQNLAALSVDGIKLDRAFGMAADGSLMAKMLVHAVEMVRASGRAIIVEGVETAERLAALGRMLPPIDFVQGYHISRPLDADRFAEFLDRSTRRSRPIEIAA